MVRKDILPKTLILVVTVIASLATKDAFPFFLGIGAYLALWIVPPGQIIIGWSRPEPKSLYEFAMRREHTSKATLNLARGADALRGLANFAQIFALIWPFAYTTLRILGVVR